MTSISITKKKRQAGEVKLRVKKFLNEQVMESKYFINRLKDEFNFSPPKYLNRFMG